MHQSVRAKKHELRFSILKKIARPLTPKKAYMQLLYEQAQEERQAWKGKAMRIGSENGFEKEESVIESCPKRLKLNSHESLTFGVRYYDRDS